MILSTMPLRSIAIDSASRTRLSISGFLPLVSGMPIDGSPCWSSGCRSRGWRPRARRGSSDRSCSLARSVVGGSSIRSTSPDSSAATRAGVVAERPQDHLRPRPACRPSSRRCARTTMRLPRCHATNLNGPVPTRPLPALSSAEVLPSGAGARMRLLRQDRQRRDVERQQRVRARWCGCARSADRRSRTFSSGGYRSCRGRAVRHLANALVGEDHVLGGEVGEPSWNFTLGRSLKSQTVSSIGFHDSARHGLASRFGIGCRPAGRTSVCATWMFGVSAWYCGSSDARLGLQRHDQVAREGAAGEGRAGDDRGGQQRTMERVEGRFSWHGSGSPVQRMREIWRLRGIELRSRKRRAARIGFSGRHGTP